MRRFLLLAVGLLVVMAGSTVETLAGAQPSVDTVGEREMAGEERTTNQEQTAGTQPGTQLGSNPPGNGQPVLSADARLSGEAQMKALARAYPDRIDGVAFYKQDWALRIADTWYFWAHGRLLPEQLRHRWEDFASYRFYTYSLDLPPIPDLDEETKNKLKERLEQAAVDPPTRYGAFLGDLYEAATRAQTEARIVTVQLMGFEVSVHQRIAPALEAVNTAVETRLETDPGVRRFVSGLKGVAGYNWREIAGTRSRSYHSYGLAVDLEPKSFGGKHTYWRWAIPRVEEWWAIPYERRWMVPPQIIELFEEQGFIWGGKWFFFDTMHFEYRPEILILAENAFPEN
jgi:hypothetical protein